MVGSVAFKRLTNILSLFLSLPDSIISCRVRLLSFFWGSIYFNKPLRIFRGGFLPFFALIPFIPRRISLAATANPAEIFP